MNNKFHLSWQLAEKYQLIKSKIEHFVVLVNASLAVNHFLFRLIFHICKKVPDFQKNLLRINRKKISIYIILFFIAWQFTRALNHFFFMVRSSFFRNLKGEWSFLLNKKPEEPSPLELDYSIVSGHFRKINVPETNSFSDQALNQTSRLIDIIDRKRNRCHLTSVKMVYTG